MVSNEILEKFKKLYQAKFSISLTDEEATQMTTDLVNLVRVLLQPEPEEKNDSHNEEERRQDETIAVQNF